MRAPERTFERARALRRVMTPPEAILWDCLRAGRVQRLRFRRQHPLGPFILDFYCPAARLAVEVDGEGHGHPDLARRDEARTRWLAAREVRVLRIAASAILDRDMLGGVLDSIAEAAACGMPPPPLRGPPPP
jgi:very-short-patch-repair endonuclease